MTRPLSALAVAVAALMLSACGPTCRSSCERAADCAQKLGSSRANIESCTKECEASTSCHNKGAYLDCMSNVKCESSMGYFGEVITCASKCDE